MQPSADLLGLVRDSSNASFDSLEVTQVAALKRGDGVLVRDDLEVIIELVHKRDTLSSIVDGSRRMRENISTGNSERQEQIRALARHNIHYKSTVRNRNFSPKGLVLLFPFLFWRHRFKMPGVTDICTHSRY